MEALPTAAFYARPFYWRAALAALAVLAAPGVSATTPSPIYGVDENCRIAALEPAPRNDDVDWSGDCEAGIATGPGKLTWYDAAKKRYTLSATLVRGKVQGQGELTTDEGVYTGTFERGLPHGTGFWRYKSGAMYEGELVAGKREGKGIYLSRDRSRYTGEWKNDKRNGWGEATFARGGSYSGQWQDDVFHGHGKIVYAGAGHTYEGKFESGRIAGTAAPLAESGSYPIYRKGIGQWDPIAVGFLPPDASWDLLTEAQKNMWRRGYPALEPGDDPPYPLKGTREAYTAVAKINKALHLAEGDLRIYVVVGADGEAKSAKVYEKPKLVEYGGKLDTMIQYMTAVMMLDRYKPAMCRGKPCEMVYPVFYRFSVE